MFDNLSAKLDRAFKNIKGQGRITELNVAATVKEIRRALIDADVNYKVAKDVTDSIRLKALGQDVLISVSPGQLLTKIVAEELTVLMGQESVPVNLDGNPNIILIAGLQGSGKTTFSGKLAHYIKKKGHSVLLVACDVYRPAAIDQLKVLGEQIDVEVFAEAENKDVISMAVDEQMMAEISGLKKEIKPAETLFVVDAMTGQDAVHTAQAFNERLDFDGVVLTKLDGDTRGGAALSVRRQVEKPIKFISTGEKMDAMDQFYPDRMAKRILGMGDVLTLVERAQQNFDEKETQRINKKIKKNQFGFDDFLIQMEQIKKMGSLKDIVGMIPGMGKAIKDVDIDDNSLKPIEAIIKSMTPKERSSPELMNGSRKIRIAKGSGTTVTEVNQLLKQFDQMRKMMKTMNKMGGAKALNSFMK
jgi:signal recognition particle subunit SRP54